MRQLGSISMSATAWLAGAATSVVIGLVALSLIGNGFADGPLQPLTPAAATPMSSGTTASDDPFTATHTITPAPKDASVSAPPASTGNTSAATDRSVSSGGGTAVFRCQPGGAYLVAWSPGPGFEADDLVRGPASAARITFEGRQSTYEIVARCSEGVIQPTVRGPFQGEPNDT